MKSVAKLMFFLLSDLLSPYRKDWIVFRNGTIVSDKYVIVGAKGIKGTVYNRQNGKQIVNFTPQEKKEIAELAQEGKDSLHDSDLLNNHNLLRFYTPTGFVPVNPTQFNYAENYQKMIEINQQLAGNSTSLYSKRGSTTKLYRTNAAELKDRKQEITQIPENVLKNQLSDSDTKKTKENK